MSDDSQPTEEIARPVIVPRLARPTTWLLLISLVYAGLVALPEVLLMIEEFDDTPMASLLGWASVWPFLGLPFALLTGVLLARIDRAAQGQRPRRAWLWLLESVWANLVAHFLVFAAWAPILFVWALSRSRVGREMEELLQAASAWIPLVLGAVMVFVTRAIRSRRGEPLPFFPGALRVPSVLLIGLTESIPLLAMGLVCVALVANTADSSWWAPAGLFGGWVVFALVASVGIVGLLAVTRRAVARVPEARQVVGRLEKKLGPWGLAGALWGLAWAPFYLMALVGDLWNGSVGWQLAIAFSAMGFILVGVALVAPAPFRRV